MRDRQGPAQLVGEGLALVGRQEGADGGAGGGNNADDVVDAEVRPVECGEPRTDRPFVGAVGMFAADAVERVRHGENERHARLEDAMHLAQQASEVVDAVDRVGGEDDLA